MTQQDIADKLYEVRGEYGKIPSLTNYAVESIEKARSNYPVSNLMSYCKDANLQIRMLDLATEDSFVPKSVLDVHKVLHLLMKRFKVDYRLVYRKTGANYTAPKSLDEEELAKLQSGPNAKKFLTPLSIKTLLAVCEVIYCDILFEPIEKAT